MSLNFIQVPAADWIGQIAGQPTNLCGGSSLNSRIVPVKIDWALYPVVENVDFGVRVNMEGVNVVNELDRVISVYIDNLGSPTPIYVWFPDTGFTAVAPPGTCGWLPVITNQRKAAIYGLGFVSARVPVTTVYFCNFFVPPSGGLASAAADGGSALTPLILNYIGSVPFTGNTASVQFPTVDFGPLSAGASRHILVGISGGNTDINTARAISAIDIASAAANIVANTGSYAVPLAAAIISDNTNLNGNIDVTFSGTVQKAICSLYTIENLANATPITATPITANPSGSGVQVTNLLTPLNIPARGIGVQFAAGRGSGGLAGSANVNFSGLPLDDSLQDAFSTFNDFRQGCAGNEFVLATPSLQATAVWSTTGDIERVAAIGLSFTP